MDRTRLIIMAGLIAAGLGCRSDSSRVRLDDPNSTGWGLENIQKASTHSNVLLVCVYEDYLERKPLGYYHLHHFKGTVVRTYKGSWEVSERVNFAFQLEAVPLNIVSNACAGGLIHLFTDFHESEEFCCQPGESRWYDPNDARDLEYLFPNGKNRGKTYEKRQLTFCCTGPGAAGSVWFQLPCRWRLLPASEFCVSPKTLKCL